MGVASHISCIWHAIWALVGRNRLYKGPLEEDFALRPFSSPRLPKKDLHNYSASRVCSRQRLCGLSFWRDPAWREELGSRCLQVGV